MGMVQALVSPGNRIIPVELSDELSCGVMPGRHSLRGFERDGGLDHRKRCGVGGGLGATDLSEDTLYLGRPRR